MHARGAFIGERFLLVGVVFLKLIVASGMAKGRYFQGKRYPIVFTRLCWFCCLFAFLSLAARRR